MTDLTPRPDEEAIEIEHVNRGPYGCAAGCVICDNHDNLVCSRGDNCCSTSPAPIGEWIGEDEDGNCTNAGAYVFAFPSIPDVYLCEDCSLELEEQASTDKKETDQ